MPGYGQKKEAVSKGLGQPLYFLVIEQELVLM